MAPEQQTQLLISLKLEARVDKHKPIPSSSVSPLFSCLLVLGIGSVVQCRTQLPRRVVGHLHHWDAVNCTTHRVHTLFASTHNANADSQAAAAKLVPEG